MAISSPITKAKPAPVWLEATERIGPSKVLAAESGPSSKR